MSQSQLRQTIHAMKKSKQMHEIRREARGQTCEQLTFTFNFACY